MDNSRLAASSMMQEAGKDGDKAIPREFNRRRREKSACLHSAVRVELFWWLNGLGENFFHSPILFI